MCTCNQCGSTMVKIDEVKEGNKKEAIYICVNCPSTETARLEQY